jgi:hypothetical protein
VTVAGNRHQSGNADNEAFHVELTHEFFCDSFRLVRWQSDAA